MPNLLHRVPGALQLKVLVKCLVVKLNGEKCNNTVQNTDEASWKWERTKHCWREPEDIFFKEYLVRIKVKRFACKQILIRGKEKLTNQQKTSNQHQKRLYTDYYWKKNEECDTDIWKQKILINYQVHFCRSVSPKITVMQSLDRF